MSRAHVPPVNVAVTMPSSPTVDAIGVKLSSMQLVNVYSGLLADSVVPDGLMTRVVLPVPTQLYRMASTSAAPYDRYISSVTSTL
jgi:hypothetical protein